VSPQQRIQVRLQLRKDTVRPHVIAPVREVRPEAFSQASAVYLPEQRAEKQLPLRNRLRARALLEINDRKTVVDIAAARLQLQRVVVLGYCRPRVPALRVIVA